MRKPYTRLVVSALFSLAMAFLEAAVVVYLRKLYYPEGFDFPLKPLPDFILYTEVAREVATIVMLWAVARLTAETGRAIFAYFCFNFGVWDLGYYVWLKILLNWPASILDWDVLFLIPLPWTGPVLAPVLVSVALVVAALMILHNEMLRLTRRDWILVLTAGAIIILSFLAQTDRLAQNQVPQNYPWWLFAGAMILGLTVFIHRIYQTRRSQDQKEDVRSDNP